MAPEDSSSPPSSEAAGASAAESEQFRLPRTVVPLRYRLTLAPDLESATFSGQVAIELDVVEPTGQLVCNAADLTVSEASLELDGETPAALEVELDPEHERVSFRAPLPVPPGPATLRCEFSGVLNDKLRGFYRSTYLDDDGQPHTIATTQMEATDARRAFPCWDEPDRKAIFEISLAVPEDLAAFSNSSVVDIEPFEGGRRLVRFAPTMRMSSYLVAFVVGPFEATRPVAVDGVPVRVVHVPGRGRLAEFALDVATHALRFFTSYFDLAYPGDKLDLLAIPDFAFGAMENLGCVTFRETALLVDREHAARTDLERVADVVCHEIAHMWFGDLVTMRWWNGIWLNEAFATFMEVLAVDAFQPAWQRWVGFGLEREAAMAIDGLHHTRPVEYTVGRPEEAEGMFDVLTYQKGASVLRMLEQYLGEAVFRDGVRAYLRRHAHANTETGDLWDALETVSGEPVRAIMESWIFQGGYPVVSPLAGSSGSLELGQAPFSYRPRQGQPSAIGGPWRVPVLWRSLEASPNEGAAPGAQPADRVLVRDQSVTLPPSRSGAESPKGGAASTTLVNAWGWGFYRVRYAPEQLELLGDRLSALDALERFNLFGDTWALTLAGRSQLADFLRLVARLDDLSEPSTWSLVAGAFGLVDRVISDEQRPQLAAAVSGLLGPAAQALGWEKRPGEPERTPTVRAQMLRTLGTLGRDEGVRAEARQRFEEGSVDPDLEASVLAIVADDVRPDDYEAMADRYRHPSDPQDEHRHLFALAAFPDAALAERTFDLSMDEVRTQDTPYLIQALLANRVGGPAIWHRLEAQWTEVLERIPTNAASRMASGVSALCSERSLADDVTAFLDAHPLPSGQRNVTQALERLQVNLDFGDRNRPTVGDVLGEAAGLRQA